MDTKITYLKKLLNKIFKLLPMREEYDAGADNFLFEYLEYLRHNYDGAFVLYPDFREDGYLVEVQSNIARLGSEDNIEFAQWRALVLRSMRLIHRAIKKYQEDANGYEIQKLKEEVKHLREIVRSVHDTHSV